MRRRFSTRDVGLTVRMTFAVAVIGCVYVALLALLLAGLIAAIADRSVVGALGELMFIVAIPVLLWRNYTGSAAAILRLTKARPDPAGDAFVPATQRLAAAADVRAPDVIVAPSGLPNALAVPTRGTPLVIVTRGLLDRLTPAETEAVIAHEISHLANRDAAVMAFVSGPALGISGLWHEGGRGWIAGAALSPVWLLGVLVTRAVSRYREYTADRGAALLTSPQQLMSALVKIHGEAPTGDLRGGRPVSALCIRGFARPWLPLLRDHPPLDKRLGRLAEMARNQGTPVGP